MSYTIGIIRPSHPAAVIDRESPLELISFTGPTHPPFHDPKWIQLQMGDNFIRLSQAQQVALMVLLQMRIEGKDSPMINLGGG
jgi:hypothetical protein